MAGNHALDTNAVVGDRPDLAITEHGSNWYWAVCALMAVSTFTFMGLSYTKKKTHRLFHYMTAGITLVASVSYYSMASGLGQTAVQAEFERPDRTEVAAAGTRQIFWVRYVDYAITTPLILTAVFLTSAIPRPTMLAALLADELMVVSYLAGALTRTSYKWGYFVFAVCASLFVVYALLLDGRRYAKALGGAANKTFVSTAGVTVVVWLLYPLAWGLSAGGNVIHPDAEAIFYGILDVVAKIVVGFVLVFGLKKVDPSDLGLHIREHTTLPRHDKHGAHRNRRDHTGPFGRRNNIAGGHHRETGDHDDRPTKHHRGPFDRHDHATNYHHSAVTADHREDTHHEDRWTGHHEKSHDPDDATHRDATIRHDWEDADYDRPTAYHSGMYDDDHRWDHHRRDAKRGGGGGILGLFRKKNYDDAYRGRDSPGRGGYHATARSPVRHDYQRRSQYQNDDAREQSPGRDEYRDRQRSPSRGEYRTDQQGPLTGGYNPDGRRSFPGDRHAGDNHRSPTRGEYRTDQGRTGGGYHPDGRRSFPGDRNAGDNRRSLPGEYRGDGHRSLPRLDDQNDRRPVPSGEYHGDGRRSVPSGEPTQGHFSGNQQHQEAPRSRPGDDSHRSGIRSVQDDNYRAEDRRPVSGTEHRPVAGTERRPVGTEYPPAARPARDSTGYGDNSRAAPGDADRADHRPTEYRPDHRPSGEYRPDHRPSAGEYRTDQGASGEFPAAQGSNAAAAKPAPHTGALHP